MTKQTHNFYIIWREWVPQQWIVSLDWEKNNITRRFNEVVWLYNKPICINGDLVQIPEEDITTTSIIIRKIRRKIWFPFETEDYNNWMDSGKWFIIPFGNWNTGMQIYSLNEFISASWREVTDDKKIRKRFEEQSNRILRIFCWESS